MNFSEEKFLSSFSLIKKEINLGSFNKEPIRKKKIHKGNHIDLLLNFQKKID